MFKCLRQNQEGSDRETGIGRTTHHKDKILQPSWQLTRTWLKISLFFIKWNLSWFESKLVCYSCCKVNSEGPKSRNCHSTWFIRNAHVGYYGSYLRGATYWRGFSAKSTSNLICIKYVYNFIDYALNWPVGDLKPKFNRKSFKITLEAPRQKLLTLLCFLWRNTSGAFLSVLFSFKSIPSDL